MEIAALYDLYLQHPNVQTDTRKLQPGCLFFALSGPNFDGNAFAAQALAQGAAYAIVDKAEAVLNDRCILVENTLTCLQDLARYHRNTFSIPFLAITGSNGKTTTKELIATVLGSTKVVYATVGNLNNHIGVPLTLLSIKKDAEIAIIEMGANHQGEIASYCLIAQPNFALITNCGKAHLEGFGGEEGVRKGKGELYDYMRAHNGAIFRNVDLDYLQPMSAGIIHQITYGTQGADIVGMPTMHHVFVGADVTYQAKVYNVASQLVGAYNFPNIMVAVAVGLHFGIPMAAIQQAIAHYSPDNSRSQWMTIGSNSVILDAYNANPTSMQAAINNFAGANLPQKRLWLGGMKEMGEAAQHEHQALVALIAQHTWDEVILVGPEFEGIAGGYLWFTTSAEAAEYIGQNMPTSAAILIKGSRGSKMELMAQRLSALQ
jgi:UDP-N-acetylmuramoyl-tripeptide--D-alanyl-D-alanine ligase